MSTFVGVLTIIAVVVAAAVTVAVLVLLLSRYRGNLPRRGASAVLLTLFVCAAVTWGLVAGFGVWKDHTLGVQHIKQGLDLQGGVTIVYEADKDLPTQDEMDTAIAIIRTRLDGMGNTEADVAQEGAKRIRVDIPGVTDANKAIEDVGQTAQLTFVDPDGNVVTDGRHITHAQGAAQQSQQGGAVENVVSIEFDAEGAKAFGDATTRLVGQPITIKLDETVISAPNVNSAITDGKAIITGGFDAKGAADLASLIRAGALPFKLNVATFNNVGAKLGVNSLSMSLWAGLIGGILVLLLMIWVYRAAGLAADLALMFYLFIELMILSLFGVTLTLPGIAGIVLSIGMAVDANVVVFERLKEEIRIGRSMKYAIDIAFSRAFSAILDGNVTTLIAAIVLYWLGTGPIKGFAVTLGVGIMVSMFSALVITRGVLKCVAGLGISKPTSYGVKMASMVVAKEAKGGGEA